MLRTVNQTVTPSERSGLVEIHRFAQNDKKGCHPECNKGYARDFSLHNDMRGKEQGVGVI